MTLTDYCDQVVRKSEKGMLPLRPNTIKCYRATSRRLKEYSRHHKNPDLSLNAIDMQFYNQFSDFLVDHSNCGIPGLNKHIKIVKRLLAMSFEEKLHTNTIHLEKAFKRPKSKPSTKVYLTTDEMESMEQLQV